MYLIRKIVFLSGLLSLLLLTACSSNKEVVIKNEFKEIPKKTRTNMTDALQCAGKELKRRQAKHLYIFLIEDMLDGTVKGNYQDGPLADAGRIQLINTLNESVYPHFGMVLHNFPLIFKLPSPQDGITQGVGLNRLGLPESKNLRAFNSVFQGIMNSSRKNSKLPIVNSISPLVISGSFTRLDTERVHQHGKGINGGVRSTDYSGQIDFGKTNSAKAISLIVNIIDPRYNLVIGSQSFDLLAYNNNKRFKLRLGAGDGFFGYSKDEITVEGVHAAQKTLLDAASLWILDKLYRNQVDISVCLNAEQEHLKSTN